FSRDYIECPESSPIFSRAKANQALLAESWGGAFHEELAIESTDKIIQKHRISGFYNTPLEAVLKAQRIERILLCGVATDMAIELTAREAHDRDYHVCVIGDACATQSF